MDKELPIIEFRLLGPFSIHHRAKPVDHMLSGPARDLLVFLLAFPECRHRRENLIERIWSEDRQPSRPAFSTTLWRLNKFLSRLPAISLESTADALRLRLGRRGFLDSAFLRKVVGKIEPAKNSEAPLLAPELRKILRRAVDCWRGPFVDGLTAEWALIERESFHNHYLRALTALMRDAGLSRRYDEALDYGRRILCEDPFRENVHCEMMWLCVLTGQRAKAITLHRRFVVLLDEELGIGPMAETTALFEYIRYGLEEVPEAPPAAVPASDSASWAIRFERFVSAAERSRWSVYDALRTMNAGIS